MTKLYITHPSFNFSTVNKNSKLLTTVKNKLTHPEYHTSLGDLAMHELLSIIHMFDSVEYVDNNFVDGEEITLDTLNFLSFINTQLHVKNSPDTKNVLSFAEHPDIKLNYNESTLWVYGCSHSHGTGLTDSSKIYGRHLAKELNIPLKLITKPGSSTHWSLRQLVNSNLKKDDIVVWQITSPFRLSFFNGKNVQEIALANCNNSSLIDTYTDDQCFFLQLSYVNIGIQYLRSVGVKFIVVSVDSRDMEFNYRYSKYPEFYCATNFAVDLGTDNLHFGPLSHKNLANTLLTRIQLLNV
jgi:hypothetical protein